MHAKKVVSSDFAMVEIPRMRRTTRYEFSKGSKIRRVHIPVSSFIPPPESGQNSYIVRFQCL